MKIHRPFLMFMIPVLLFSACTKETEEDKIKKVITSVQQAAEEIAAPAAATAR